jgi:endonuclease/exonuclease/phosphatase family metal-dependent hydrolase
VQSEGELGLELGYDPRMSSKWAVRLGVVVIWSFLGLGVAEEKVPVAPEQEFTVMAYNVENLADVDRVAPYDDYLESPDDPNSYSPSKLARKLRTVTTVLKSVSNGKGPDVVILNELEMDHTPDSKVGDWKQFLEKYAGTTYEKMLSSDLTDELRGLPTEAWLLKALEDEGLKGYTILVGKLPEGATQHQDAITNGLLTRFPVVFTQTIDTPSARGILEAKLQVGEATFTVMGNHWKSGAGNPAMENTRLGNAKTVRDRLDQILQEDPKADVIIGGDFNTQYNQGQRYSFMTKTALQDVLGSQGDRKALGGTGKPDLYNLWFDVPPEKRYSDEFAGEWGTLMQLLVTRGMGDGTGVEYVEGSFHQVMVPGVNCREPLGLPWRWTNYGPGWGASDHFPVMATFRVGGTPLKGGVSATQSSVPQAQALKVGYDKIDRSKLRNASVLKDATAEDIAKAMGEIFLVQGTISKVRPLEIELDGKPYALHSFDKNLKTSIRLFAKGSQVTMLGELGLFKGKLQFIVQDPSWIK